MIVREASTGRPWLYPGTGTGGLGTAANGDWSGDGRPDLIATKAGDGMLYRYAGTGRGGLGAGDWLGGGPWRDLNGAF